jgi:Bromodomain
MDFSTIDRKLIASHPLKPDLSENAPRYYSADEFIADVRLIFQNTATFNGPDHVVTAMGRRLQDVFDKQLKNLPPADVCLLGIFRVRLLICVLIFIFL